MIQFLLIDQFGVGQRHENSALHTVEGIDRILLQQDANFYQHSIFQKKLHKSDRVKT
jgi:hypothetical protein